MRPSLGSFARALTAGWVLLFCASWLYSQAKSIPAWAATPAAASFLVEFLFYLAPGFEAVRKLMVSRLPGWRLGVFCGVSALMPFTTYSVFTGTFRVSAFLVLTLLSTVLSFWYLVFPGTLAADIGFLSLVAYIILSGLLKTLYASPVPHLPMEILGHVTLIRLAITVLLLERKIEGSGFGFLPTWREIGVGVVYFLGFLPIGIPLAMYLGVVHLRAAHLPLWQSAALLVGVFWVVALSEEFFFRGVLQNEISRKTGRPWAALLVVSAIFGASHLWLRQFPNWRFAILAGIAGVFYGAAYRKSGSVRASMVSHTLVVGAWRLFFS